MMTTATWIAAFDAGGDDATEVLTVAGFVSSTQDWDVFSRLWKARLADEGIEYFHAVDAAHFREQFQPWRDRPDREQLRRRLFVDLMEILKSHVYRKFGCTILNKHFHTLSEENRKLYRLRALSVAGRTCDKHVREWAKAERITPPIKLVFEAGDAGHTDLRIRITTDTGCAPIFRRKKNTVLDDGGMEDGFVPLQAADWLAYEISKAHVEFEAGKLHSFRWPMEQFNSTHGEPSTYTEADLEKMEELLKLNRAISEWSDSLTSKADS